jgi:diguanylate cyclase (GGDEF)-like protein
VGGLACGGRTQSAACKPNPYHGQGVLDFPAMCDVPVPPAAEPTLGSPVDPAAEPTLGSPVDPAAEPRLGSPVDPAAEPRLDAVGAWTHTSTHCETPVTEDASTGPSAGAQQPTPISKSRRRVDEDDRTVVTVLTREPPVARARTDACLVMIYGPELGRRVALSRENPIEIGRQPNCDFQIDQESVSRRHARIVWSNENWHAIDLGSTNGTLVNDEVVTDRALRDGDQIKIGRAILKFLEGGSVETSYHEEIYRLMTYDGLTGIHNKRYFHEALEREVSRCKRYAGLLSLTLFDIDLFKCVNDTYGHIAGDAVLRQLASLVRAKIRREDIFARVGGEDFALIMPEVGGPEAIAFAEEVRIAVEGLEFNFDAVPLRLTISLGVASLEPGSSTATSEQLYARAEELLYAAKRSGRNCVVGETSPQASVGFRKIVDGSMLQSLISAEPVRYKGLAVFEIADEKRVLAALGSSGYQKWVDELVRDAEAIGGPDNDLALWRDRYVLLATRSSRNMSEVCSAVRQTWEEREGDPNLRALHSAAFDAPEIASLPERAVDRLVARLGSEVGATLTEALPYPLAALRPLVDSQTEVFKRLVTTAYGLETALRYLFAVEFAWVRDFEDPARHDRLAQHLNAAGRLGKNLGLGDLEELVWKTAALISPGRTPVAAIANAFSTKTGGRSVLSKRVSQVVGIRNRTSSHTVIGDPRSYSGEEDSLRSVLDAILAACAPLSDTTLASVAQMVGFGDSDESFVYDLHQHRGPVDLFPVVRQSVAARLQPNWCYLLGEGHQPLLLAPMVFALPCETCRRVRLYLASSLTTGPKGTKTRGREIALDHEGSCDLPSGASMQRFDELVQRVSGSG